VNVREAVLEAADARAADTVAGGDPVVDPADAVEVRAGDPVDAVEVRAAGPADAVEVQAVDAVEDAVATIARPSKPSTWSGSST
jgi:hypothetical protein